MSAPLLDIDDFIRLTASGIWSLRTRHEGLPPPWPELPRAAEENFEQLGLKKHLGELHQIMTGFFGLDEKTEKPECRLSLRDYALSLYEAWGKGTQDIVFHSSGSTGLPKAARHSRARLAQEVAAVTGLFQNPVRIVSTAPLLHSYGFIFGLLLPKFIRRPALSVVPLPGIVSKNLRAGDLLISFPWLLSKLEQTPAAPVDILCSTAPCPPLLFSRLPESGFRALGEIYGSSETGAVAFRNSLGPFRLLDHWKRADDGQNLFRRKTAGDSGGFHPQLDHLDWHDDRSFLPLGRVDQAVQVGGVNVYPLYVAGLIEKEAGVKEAAVRLMSPEEGERLKAFIATEENQIISDLKSRLNRLFQRLSPPERPASLTFGAELPRSSAGKLKDWEI